MSQPIAVVDAFTDRPFAGNPAAVCLLPRPAEDTWMQAVAREMNLSETAFLACEPDGFGLRWFTPAAEVALCGHATLASAHHLWEMGALAPGAPARFHTKSGLLTATRRDAWIEMDFPAKPAQAATPAPELSRALGAGAPAWFGVSAFDALAELGTERQVRELKPDIGAIGALPYRGLIVTARAAAGFDFVSRFFAPNVGVSEDPVTGSAHCVLAPHWRERLGKDDMVGFQASARGGVVRVGVRGERVLLGGQAVTVWKGELL